MPNIAALHPQVVHFVVALALVGVVFRLIALTGRWTWMSNAAAALLVVAAGASVLSVRSGLDAHGPVERVPGSRTAVQAHEDWGTRTRNVLLVLAALEIIAIFVPVGRRRLVHVGAAVLGLAGVAAVVKTADLGGDLVYGYAGGIGLRSGDPEDVKRLLLAGLYHEAMQDRKSGHRDDAARLIDEMSRQRPEDASVRMLRVESMLRDRNDAAGALVALDSIQAPADNPRARAGINSLRADALEAVGMKDSARAIVRGLIKDFPTNERFKAKLDSLQ